MKTETLEKANRLTTDLRNLRDYKDVINRITSGQDMRSEILVSIVRETSRGTDPYIKLFDIKNCVKSDPAFLEKVQDLASDLTDRIESLIEKQIKKLEKEFENLKD